MADVTDLTFEAEVVDRSAKVPVVVDLWAPWCGPCQTLGPIIEKVIADRAGQVELAKVNVDENPGISQAFQVQGIPAVYALVDGKVVDGFVGAQPEPMVAEFVDRVIASSGLGSAEIDGEATDAIAEEAAAPEAADAEPETPVDVALITGELETLLDRAVDDDDARARYLELLDQLGDRPEAAEHRKRLSARLF